MKLYGIASRVSSDIDEWKMTREDAETELAQVLRDAPEFRDDLYVAEIRIELSEN